MTYKVIVTPKAREMWLSIQDRRIRAKIYDRAMDLASDPALQGKRMDEDLIDFRSLRAVGQRYRILYRIDEERRIVWVKAVGIRKRGDRNDIYVLASKLVRLGVL